MNCVRSSDELKVFTGAHGKTMIDEMKRGFSGTMPAASFADLYATAWDLWQQGKQKEAIAIFGRISMIITEVSVYGIESLKSFCNFEGCSRRTTRAKRSNSQSAASIGLGGHLDESGKDVVRQMIEYVKPWMRA